MDSTTSAIVEATNPWLFGSGRFADADRRPAPFIRRRGAGALARALGQDDKVHLVIGPRQVGKSTLVRALLAEHGAPVLFLNCEERAIRAWCSSPALFARDLAELLPGGGTVYFEEAQWLDEAGLFLKGLVDARTGRRIVATGSSSFHLLAKTRESLAGRATRHRLFPLSLAEVAPGGPLPAILHVQRRRALDRLLVVGGYPEAWTSEHPDRVLRGLVEAFVLRDASDRFRIQRPDVLRRLLELVAGQVGDLVNASEWAALLGVAGTTVADYLAVLEETHVICRVRPFIGGKRAELTKTPKAYFVDIGLRNALRGGFAPLDARIDNGRLLESHVFAELLLRWPEPGGVRFWRSKNGAEVDFVIAPTPGRVIAVEVKAGRARLSRSARSFVQAYAPEQLLLVHRGDAREDLVGSTRVRWVPAEHLPEVLDALSEPG